jgi:hypothetical protein
MQHRPRDLIRPQPERALHPQRRDPVLLTGHLPRSLKPQPERRPSAIEDRPRRDRRLAPTDSALPPPDATPPAIPPRTPGTAHSIRPAQPLQGLIPNVDIEGAGLQTDTLPDDPELTHEPQEPRPRLTRTASRITAPATIRRGARPRQSGPMCNRSHPPADQTQQQTTRRRHGSFDETSYGHSVAHMRRAVCASSRTVSRPE